MSISNKAVISVIESIGTILRHERERRGLSIQEVFESTKITTLNVEALELDRFESFPNKVYARAFLRDYANFLDLDSGTLLQRYEAEWFAIPAIETLPAVPKKRINVTAIVLTIILVMILVAGGYVWQTYYSGDTTNQDNTTSVRSISNLDTTEPNNITSDTKTPLTPSSTTLPDNNTPRKSVTPLVTIPPVVTVKPPVSGLVLTVSATNEVWVGIIGDGKVLYQNNITAGHSMTWTAQRKISIRVGVLQSVQVKLNGVLKKLRPTSKSRRPIGVAEFGLKNTQPVLKSTHSIAP